MKSNENSKKEQSRLGAFMLFGAWIIGLGLLTYLFDIYLSKQANPNQQVHSQVLADGSHEVVLKANRQNQYITTGIINNHKVRFLLDTGATDVAIPEDIAKKLKLKYGARGQAMTANGLVTIYRTLIDDLHIGNIHLKNIRASITTGLNGEFILLGMSALKEITFIQRDGKLTLIQHAE